MTIFSYIPIQNKTTSNTSQWCAINEKQAQFYASRKKSGFFAASMDVLGHIIDDQGLRASPEKIARMEAWTTPKNKKQLQEFLGVVNYVSQFIPHLASITAPLTSLTGTEEFV